MRILHPLPLSLPPTWLSLPEMTCVRMFAGAAASEQVIAYIFAKHVSFWRHFPFFFFYGLGANSSDGSLSRDKKSWPMRPKIRIRAFFSYFYYISI